MAHWETEIWEPTVESGVPRRDRRFGGYKRYVPDLLEAHPLTLDTPLSRKVAEAERSVQQLNGPGAEALASIARFLLRSEAIASSRIEGLAASPQQVALAELGSHETVRGISQQAQWVANNITVVRRATTELVEAREVTTEHIVELHRALLPDQPSHHGLRVVQNWIGGSDWHPIEADFVPPAPELVPDLMRDLADFVNGASHSPVVQAALTHAQFETIHPFTDGNGRVGRALIHTVLTRRGLTSTAVLPVSLVLSTLRSTYVEGLTAFRHDGESSSPEAVEGVRAWVDIFADAVLAAAGQSTDLVDQIVVLQADWQRRVAEHRAAQGIRQRPRGNSATARLVALLPEAPVVTVATVQRILGVSQPAASAALDELTEAGLFDTRRIERGTTAYLATEILDLVTHAERRLASTRFDTRISGPNRPVPARPQRRDSSGPG